MAIFETPALSDTLISMAAAAAGRASLLLRVTKQSLTLRSVMWTVLYEIPITASMGFIGYSTAIALGFGDQQVCVLIIAMISRWGPDRILEPVLENLIPAIRKANREAEKPATPEKKED